MDDELFMCDKCLKEFEIFDIKIFNYEAEDVCSEHMGLTIICNSCYQE